MFRTIKFKMLVLIAFCMGLGALGLVWTFQTSHKKDTERLTEEAIGGAVAAFMDLNRTSIELMSAAVDILVRDPEMRKALAAKDAAALMTYAEPLFRDFQSRYGITLWNYWEPEPADQPAPKGLRNLLRVQLPKVRGEVLERYTLARVVRERRPVTGLDLGASGLVLRVLVPVLEGQRALGYTELGKEIGNFLQAMKRLNGDDFGLLVSKKSMNEKTWAASCAAKGLRNNWGDMPDLLLVENTSGSSEILRYDGKIDTIPDLGQPLEIVTRGDKKLARGVFAIRDASGAKIGAVFVLRNVTVNFRELMSTQRQAIVVMIALMIVLAIVLITAFHLMVVRRLQRMIHVATRVVGGEFSLEVVPSARDELGRFETLFEQFRRLFVELTGHVQQATGGTTGTSGATGTTGTTKATGTPDSTGVTDTAGTTTRDAR